MSMYSVYTIVMSFGICPDEAEHPQAYSYSEGLPIYDLNNVEM